MTRAQSLLTVVAAALSACSTPSVNPTSLWVDFENREVDLVLVDNEPPPF